jgi:hypothetical protein
MATLPHPISSQSSRNVIIPFAYKSNINSGEHEKEFVLKFVLKVFVLKVEIG